VVEIHQIKSATRGFYLLRLTDLIVEKIRNIKGWNDNSAFYHTGVGGGAGIFNYRLAYTPVSPVQ
jgi:hypothetical protein